jgi:GT2 family glycosyltransferase
METESVTIVIPTHQRRRSLARVLQGLAEQTCPPGSFSVVVVCDGCTDGTAEMLREASYPFSIQVIEQTPSLGPAAARNRATSIVPSPIVLFLDDDVIPSEDLVKIHVGHHACQDDLVVIGPLIPPVERQQPWIRWEADTLQKQYREMLTGAWSPTARQFYTGNASVRRHHLRVAGGFDERFRRGEDVALAIRLQHQGLHFVFEPRARGIHIARRTYGSWIAAAREYGRVEVAMEPIWDDRRLVDIKVGEFKQRHPFVRLVVAIGLAHPRLANGIIAAGGAAGWMFAAVGLWKVARGAYTVIFELAYWLGVRDAGGVMAPDPSRIDGIRGLSRMP